MPKDNFAFAASSEFAQAVRGLTHCELSEVKLKGHTLFGVTHDAKRCERERLIQEGQRQLQGEIAESDDAANEAVEHKEVIAVLVVHAGFHPCRGGGRR